MGKTHGQASVIVEEAKVISFISIKCTDYACLGTERLRGIKKPGVPMIKNPEHKQQRSYSYTGSRSRSRNPTGRANKARSRNQGHERNRTWWMGGYMELVQTGHSSSSCTPVAGDITSGPAPATGPAAPVRSETTTTLTAAAAVPAVEEDLRKGRGSWDEVTAAVSSSSSMPSE